MELKNQYHQAQEDISVKDEIIRMRDKVICDLEELFAVGEETRNTAIIKVRFAYSQ
jgi:hypothetical protein